MVEKEITMGNFFSGSGTWELVAKMVGMKVVFESEIEPFPVALEAKRFPEAIQLGDITKVSGYDIPPINVLCNSSPCQDLSVAGRRAGMEQESGTRSSLFHEVIRITKEMRENVRRNQGADYVNRYPKWWLWENVPGALSSNNGEDFRCVLEKVAKIASEDAVVPMPLSGKWSNAGLLDGDGYQIAWRVIDAQYFGVPQRRRRIYLVADFGGRRAGEVLFESARMPWNFAEITKTWEDTSRSLEDRINAAGEYIRSGLEQSKLDESVFR